MPIYCRTTNIRKSILYNQQKTKTTPYTLSVNTIDYVTTNCRARYLLCVRGWLSPVNTNHACIVKLCLISHPGKHAILGQNWTRIGISFGRYSTHLIIFCNFQQCCALCWIDWIVTIRQTFMINALFDNTNPFHLEHVLQGHNSIIYYFYRLFKLAKQIP